VLFAMPTDDEGMPTSSSGLASEPKAGLVGLVEGAVALNALPFLEFNAAYLDFCRLQPKVVNL
jgi:hypothetical protein